MFLPTGQAPGMLQVSSKVYKTGFAENTFLSSIE